MDGEGEFHVKEHDEIRVMVVDDQELMRDGLIAVLERQRGITIVASAADGNEALERAEEAHPHIVLMDVRMPTMDGVRAAAEFRERMPEIGVLMLTTFDDETYVVEALRAGAVGYILKNIPARDLADAIRMAHRRIVQLDDAAARRLAEALAAGRGEVGAPAVPHAVAEGLTNREREVMRLVADGANNREIAARLFISEGTVKSHVSSILARLGLRDRTQIAVYTYQNRHPAE